MKVPKAFLVVILFFMISPANAADQALMMDKFEDPLAGMVATLGAENVADARSQMGESGKIVEYNHCIQNVSIAKESFKEMSKAQIEQAAEEGQFNDIKSVKLLDKCPLPANGACDHVNRLEYFYTDSSTLLDEQKEGCEFFKMKWLTFDIDAKD